MNKKNKKNNPILDDILDTQESSTKIPEDFKEVLMAGIINEEIKINTCEDLLDFQNKVLNNFNNDLLDMTKTRQLFSISESILKTLTEINKNKQVNETNIKIPALKLTILEEE